MSVSSLESWTPCPDLRPYHFLDIMSRIGPMPNRASARTRDRVIDTVRGLLAEGSFHESTVEEVADRAGISRATLYTHFGSRTGLVDAICEGLGGAWALREI